jgi:hypothetical protein
MDDLWGIISSWQFIVMGCVVFLIVAFFNGLGKWKGIGPYLWGTGNKPIRKFLKFMEAVKIPTMFLLGFGLGWIPAVPRPEQLAEVSQFTIALIYGIAGLFSIVIVKWVKKMAEARGIDIELDLDPKEQKKAKSR